MLLPKRTAWPSHLLKEGVVVAKKDFTKPSHDDIEEVPNLHVIKLMTSLKSRGYVGELLDVILLVRDG